MSISASRVESIARRLLPGKKIACWYRELDANDTLGAAKGAFELHQAGLPMALSARFVSPPTTPPRS